MTRKPIPYDQLRPTNITGVEDFSDFKCSDPEFEEYLRVSALYDQNAGMGRTYAFMHEGRIVGYVVLAAADVPDKEQKRLNIDTYGSVPALLISHLATHEQYERRRVGRNMVLWSIGYAKNLAKNIGCRIVLVGAKPDVSGFYEKMGFVHAGAKTGALGAGRLSWPRRWYRAAARKDLTDIMYFDLMKD